MNVAIDRHSPLPVQSHINQVRPPPGQGEEKTYIGNALTKKQVVLAFPGVAFLISQQCQMILAFTKCIFQAKTNAANAAWADLSSGVSVVDPESVDKLLSGEKY